MDDYNDYNDYNSSESDYNSTLSDIFFVEYYIAPCIIALVNIFGLFGNGALALILRKTPASNAPYVCILNLAIADLMVLIFYLPFALMFRFPYGEPICKISETLASTSTGGTAFSLIALAGYSFYSRETVSSRSEWSRKNVKIVIAIIWILAFAFAAPMIVFAHLTSDGSTSYAYCTTFDPLVQQVEGPLRFIIYYTIPLSAVGIFYCMAKQNFRSNIGSDNSNLAIWLVVVYAIAFLGEHLSTLWFVLDSDDEKYWPLFNVVCYLIGILYRCINPVVLYFVSDTFRSLFKENVLYWCSSKTQKPVVDLSSNREVGTGA